MALPPTRLKSVRPPLERPGIADLTEELAAEEAAGSAASPGKPQRRAASPRRQK